MVGWHHWLNGHESLNKFRELVMDREAWRAEVLGVAKSRTWLSDWTDTWVNGYIMWHQSKGQAWKQKTQPLRYVGFFLHTKQWNTEVWSQIKRINSDQAMQSFLTKQPVDFLHFYISCDQRHWQSFTLDYFLIMFYNKKLWKVGEAVCF